MYLYLCLRYILKVSSPTLPSSHLLNEGDIFMGYGELEMLIISEITLKMNGVIHEDENRK